ncbi:coproporphyrinogen dehydrogenase HemZ [Sporomusa aerivorans]|uniref:coproporphyrinogen dehydrogenase HemZ n=1 Tax=Sporomusa aerivorans TaxID=204936 RepID=UPI00352B338A
MRIEEFFYVAGDADCLDVLGAVRDTMALFKVGYAGLWPAAARLSELKENCILVTTASRYDSNEVTVDITIHYHKLNGDLTAAVTNRESRRLSPGNARNNEGEDIPGLCRRLARLIILTLMRKITGSNPGPWGILRGVRPTKIVHRLLDLGCHQSEIPEKLRADYALEPSKAKLIADIAVHQRPIIACRDNPPQSRKVSVYIGVPYCPSRCLYCSFPANVVPERREQLDAFLRAITKDIESAAQLVAQYNLAVESIYVGGGTPTSLSADDLSKLLQLVKSLFWGAQTQELTVEAGRPDSISDEKIAVLRQHKINRVSINPQSMQDKSLKQIGRRHTVQDIIDTFGKIRQAAIPVVNMDVIAGLPGETVADMEDTMRQLAALKPENITVHTLAIKRGSQLKDSLDAGLIAGQALPDETTTQEMLTVAADYTTRMGMQPYYLYRQKYMTGNLENVGYALPGTDCLYNIQIMEERQTIIGIGPAAGTKAVNSNNWRLQSCYNAKDVATYIKNLEIYLSERNTLLSRLYGDSEED